MQTNRRILLIDDNEAIHADYRKILADAAGNSEKRDQLKAAIFGECPAPSRPLDYQIESAYQGEEGVRKAREAVEMDCPYAMAFVDMRMPPGLDGLETIERLRREDPGIQVVICTAYSDYSWEQIHQRLGHTDQLLILKKPFDNAEVYQLAAALTEKRHLAELAIARFNDLDKLVAERTSELESANRALRNSNDRLQQEILERRRLEDRLRHDAFHDPLTNLPNRALLLERIGRAIERAKRIPEYHYAILFLDLDNFKLVNDSLGHRMGDELLVEIAERMALQFRSMDTASRPADDTTARLGGDEFVILLDGLKKPSDVSIAAERINAAMKAPFVLAGTEITLSVSMGIATNQTTYDDPHEILRDADTALYEAKARGKACFVIFGREMRERAVTRLRLENDLHRAIEGRQLRLAFQPIISLISGEIEGFEALVRWIHPELGQISPGEFIPIAEENGLIVPIGKWVLEEACKQGRIWQRMLPGTAELYISVNMAVRQLASSKLLESIEGVLERTGLSPHLLAVEITESVLIDDPLMIGETLTRLRDRHIKVWLDDFGTGYSSLSYLHDLPLDGIKIDRSFIKELAEDSSHLATIEALLVLANSRGFKVVAEGVENAEQLSRLQALDCESAQGYYFAQPHDAETAERLLKTRGGWRTFPRLVEETARAS